MRRSITFLLGGLLGTALVLGPVVGIAAARSPLAAPTGSATFWTCYPDGSTPEIGPTTTTSSALFFANPSQDAISCFFPNVAPASTSSFFGFGSIQFGGTCVYRNGNMTVSFLHRFYVVHGNSASLACWDGVLECSATLSGPSLPQCLSSVAPASRRKLT